MSTKPESEQTDLNSKNSARHSKPKLRAILLLRCPRCVRTPLQKSRSWLQFRLGCEKCDYQYEREPGYFWGASWMITYTFASLGSLAVAITLLVYYPDWSGLKTALVAVAPILPIAVAIQPFSRAAWMVFDHFHNPLNDFERLDSPIGH